MFRRLKERLNNQSMRAYDRIKIAQSIDSLFSSRRYDIPMEEQDYVKR